MPRLTPDDVRFQIRRGVQSLSRSVLRDLAGKPDVRERAIDAAVRVLAGRFEGCEVVAPDPPPGRDFADMDRPA